MRYINKTRVFLGLIIVSSLVFKLILVFTYKNYLTLSSDDLNYIKSAVILAERNVFVFFNLNEPTVFVTPLYPLFLSFIFKMFGYGLFGLQMVRIVQAVISSITILLVFMISKELFQKRTALLSSFMVAFYVPNIITVGYMLTETLFTMLFYLLIYLSIKFSKKPGIPSFLLLGILLAVTSLCRPTIALYPVLFFPYIWLYRKIPFKKLLKLGAAMAVSFVLIMAPWWVRNYMEYSEFIPLAASSGNPMLQGTYVDYKQTPENITYYKLGKTSFETNKNEVEAAKKRMKQGFKEDFWGYLGWYTIGKTLYLWGTVFYWKAFFNIPASFVYIYHYILLIGFFGIFTALFHNIKKYMLPISLLVYFNVVHCVYMAFDRYAFPLMPILSMFSAYFIINIVSYIKSESYF